MPEDDTLLTQEEDTQQTIEEEGAQEKSWRDELLPDDLKDLPAFEKYKSPQDAFKGFAEMQKLIGKKGIIPPGEDATDEERLQFKSEVAKIMGDEIPETYELPEPEDLPEEVAETYDVTKKKILDYATEHKIPKGEAERLHNLAIDILKDDWNAAVEAQKAEKMAAEKELRDKWGRAFDSKVKAAKKVIDTFGTEGLKSKIGVYGNDPHIIETLANLAEKMGEDSISGKAKTVIMTPEEARHEIYKIKGDPNHPFNTEGHPERGLAMKKMDDLYKMAFPELAKDNV